MKNNFAVLILTHGRPDNVKTITALKKCGYTGDIVLVLDDEDLTYEQYKAAYPKIKIAIFNKKKYADQVDEANNFDNRRTTTHARNACFDIAEHFGYEYFIVLDDDYTAFEYRLLIDDNAIVTNIKNLDAVLPLFVQYYKSCNFKTIALAQGGDFIGGLDNGKGVYRFSKRKCMNSFICSTKRRFQFVGQLNEDVNTYITLGSRGDLFMTIPFASIVQTATQSNKGGMTDAYIKYGTYCKAFTTTMMHPSSVSVSMMNTTHQRIHHSIAWGNTTPMIISENYRK